MKWILVWIALNHTTIHFAYEHGRYDSMNECFLIREELIEKVGKPIINYQAVCIPYNKDLLFKEGRKVPKL